ncbi:MAG TPA: T9SS type A sorting domain-containing protein [Saprospiraceae bacterium]|nr:T9SS type A sorting domain-containing protein [Saprospiraceae bacterium]
MKIVYNISFFVMLCFHVAAQQGLEGIIVEKYYVSNENDKVVDGDGGELPVNSVTYRVYVDMLPGYIFQAAYGVPEHELKISTTTRFFNNEDRGNRFPTYSRSQAQNNTVMLDSWLSVGAALKDYAGVLKTQDDGVNTIVNADGVLQNDDVEAGIPLTMQDGAVLAPSEAVTVVGFFDADLSVFDDGNAGPIPTVMSTHDGAWSALNGAMGPDSTDNKVLIGQFTTDGVFEFELNIQIRNQQTLGVEKYVARDPVGDEIRWYQLIYNQETIAVEDEFVFLNDDQINVYPNPTTGLVKVDIDRQIPLTGADNQYTLRSLDGAVVDNGNIAAYATELELHHLTPGVYILSLQLENKYQYNGKVVVIR